MVNGQMVFSGAVAPKEIEDVSEELSSISKILRQAGIEYSRAFVYAEVISKISLVTLKDRYGDIVGAMIVPVIVEDGGIGFGAKLDDEVRFFESGAVTMTCSSN